MSATARTIQLGRQADDELRAAVAAVTDPEIPVLTIADLGILRDVHMAPDGQVEVIITPTYSGCPAMETIRADIVQVLRRRGVDDVHVRVTLSPAWTTDWMSEDGKRKLRAYGVSPPTGRAPAPPGPVPVRLSVRSPLRPPVPCPQCGSSDTRETSRFGSTACKALYRCRSCLEPFDHFKAI